MYSANVITNIEACFNKLGIVTESYGRSAWTLALPQVPRIPVYAFIDEMWLCLDIPLDRPITESSIGSCLMSQSVLPGAAKFSLDPQQRRLHLQAEIPLWEDAPLRAGLQETLNALGTAASAGSVEPPAESAIADPRSEIPEDVMEQIVAACDEAGWVYSARGKSLLSVELTVRRKPYVARITVDGSGVRVGAEFLRLDAVEAHERFALSALLLSAAREIRWARPYADAPENGGSVGFEVRFPSVPGPGEVSHALGAISTALSLCAEEAMALRDKSIATQFLLVRGLTQ